MAQPPPSDPAPGTGADARPARGWEPYLAPYAAFLILVEIGARLPDALAPALLVANALVPGVLLLIYARAGRYPELEGYRLGPGSLADLAVGLAVAALWMGPYVLGGWSQPPPEEGFDPELLGSGRSALALALRLLGFALVTPFLEELFVRSFLLRACELVSLVRGHLEIDATRDFRDLPIARYSRWSFAITVLYFTFSHVPWEWPVALGAGVAYNLWLYARGHLGAVILAHTTTNLAIWLVVVVAAERGVALWQFL